MQYRTGHLDRCQSTQRDTHRLGRSSLPPAHESLLVPCVGNEEDVDCSIVEGGLRFISSVGDISTLSQHREEPIEGFPLPSALSIRQYVLGTLNELRETLLGCVLNRIDA